MEASLAYNARTASQWAEARTVAWNRSMELQYGTAQFRGDVAVIRSDLAEVGCERSAVRTAPQHQALADRKAPEVACPESFRENEGPWRPTRARAKRWRGRPAPPPHASPQEATSAQPRAQAVSLKDTVATESDEK